MTPTPHALVRRLLGFAVGFAAALGIIAATELGADTSTRGEVLGHLDIAAHCRAADEPLDAALRSEDAFGWRCIGRRNGIWGIERVDVDAACRQQYGPRARAVTTDVDEPNSWTCVAR